MRKDKDVLKQALEEEKEQFTVLGAMKDTMLTAHKLVSIDDSKEGLLKGLIILTEINDKLYTFQKALLEPPIKRLEAEIAKQDIAIKRIDKEVFRNKKIDFEKLEVNIDRIESKANLINSLNSIKGVISSYHEKCNRLNLHECASIAEKLMKSIDITSELIKMEIEKQKEQLGNVNLFYQNYMVERAIKIAYASLFVSALAFLLTVLQAVHIL